MQAVVLAHAVLAELVELAGEIGGVAVGEVAAVAEVHAEHLVARLQHGGVDGEVGLRAGVRLHVGVLGAEELLGALDGQHLDLVDLFAAAVPAPARIALGVLVGEHAALGLEHGRVGEVLGGDQLDVVLLAREFAGDGGVNLGIELAEGGGVERHGGRMRDRRESSAVSQAAWQETGVGGRATRAAVMVLRKLTTLGTASTRLSRQPRRR